jgi:hypothetical protein
MFNYVNNTLAYGVLSIPNQNILFQITKFLRLVFSRGRGWANVPIFRSFAKTRKNIFSGHPGERGFGVGFGRVFDSTLSQSGFFVFSQSFMLIVIIVKKEIGANGWRMLSDSSNLIPARRRLRSTSVRWRILNSRLRSIREFKICTHQDVVESYAKPSFWDVAPFEF